MFGEAIYQGLGCPEGDFLRDFSTMRETAIQRVLDASALGACLPDWLEEKPNQRFFGTMKALLGELKEFTNTESAYDDKLPRYPRGLGDALRRLSPALRSIGIYVSIDPQRKKDGIHVIIENKSMNQCSPSSSSSSAGNLKQDPGEHGEHDEHGIKNIFYQEQF